MYARSLNAQRTDDCCDERVCCRTCIKLPIDQQVTFYYCFNKSLKHEVSYNACTEENCNTQLFLRLPSEPTVPTTYPPYRPLTTSNEPTIIASTNTVVSTDVYIPIMVVMKASPLQSNTDCHDIWQLSARATY